ncbi:sodium-dependent transporter [uncultured Maricaulis sp.]|uniref:sodium-dependent transporter n=1 Tax=uncultured Maricaulis sp. TaxID=174710 RepID=UPI0030D77B7E|tara:strand:- start:69134 stop:70486 length:1353 start_codon:yes stop_codon:yes gene_type:complete
MAAALASTHAHWSSRFAFIMAAVGSAVGLGNLWRFPFMTGQNGGSAFVLIYIGCVLLFALPVLMAELAIGRHAQQSAITSTRKMAIEAGKSGKWSVVGWVCTAAGFLVLTTYSVIAGQVMAFSLAGFAGGFAQPDGATMFYQTDGIKMFWHFAFMVLTVLIVSRGLKGGIERVATILMPLFFVVLIGLTVYSMMNGAAGQAISYLFAPDFTAVTGQTFIAALGQAFFSVSVASAIMITYGSYLPRDSNIGSSAVLIVSADTMVALIAGLMIFPIVFMVGMDPAAGLGLIFTALPQVFSTMPAGNLIGGAFFALAFIAALTSSISLLEATVAFVEENASFGRSMTAWLLGTFAFLIGAGAVYSEAFAGGFIDVLSGQILLPLGGFLVAVFAGWVIPKSLMRSELHQASPGLFAFFHFAVRYFVPLAIGSILVVGLDDRFNDGRIGALVGLG